MANRLRSSSLLGLAVLGATAVTAAQDAPAQAPAFDVVSIKPFVEGGPRRVEWTPGRFIAQGSPFPGLVNMAYGGGAPVRLEGGGAVRQTTWDVAATFDPAFTPSLEQRAAMLRAVLEDRFRLVLRRESRETEVYALLLVRPDGRPGPSLQPSELPCTSPPRARFSPGAPPEGVRPACGPPVVSIAAAGSIVGGDIVLENLTRALGSLLQRPVVDRTGLSGKFDLALTFAWDSATRQSPVPLERPLDPGGPPTIFTALREQLGLRVESTRAPLDYHIVERVEMPTPN